MAGLSDEVCWEADGCICRDPGGNPIETLCKLLIQGFVLTCVNTFLLLGHSLYCGSHGDNTDGTICSITVSSNTFIDLKPEEFETFELKV